MEPISRRRDVNNSGETIAGIQDGQKELHKQKGKKQRARIFKRLWSTGIDSKKGIPPAYVAWRSRITLFLLGT
jgi:hypothetical protein